MGRWHARPPFLVLGVAAVALLILVVVPAYEPTPRTSDLEAFRNPRVSADGLTVTVDLPGQLQCANETFDGLEVEIDLLNAELSPLTSFVLPGGTPAAAHLHLARTVSRRAERIMVELADQPDEIVNPAAIRFANRLSDFFFVAARWVNDKGRSDVLWVPGKNR